MEEFTGGLTASEEKFFESGGETEIDEVQEEQSTDESPSNTAESEVKEVVEEKPRQDERKVPLAALHQSRQELKEAKAKMEKMEAIFQRFQQDQRAAQEPQLPSREENPVGYFETKIEQLQREQREFQQQQKEYVEREQAKQQEHHFYNAVKSVESEFASKTPDYFEAAEFLKQQIANDLYNRGTDESEIQGAVTQQMQIMIAQAANVGINPAQLAYDMARTRGFKGKQAAATGAVDKIDSINKGQKVAKSLSSTSGKSSHEITLESMLEMDDEELEKHWKKSKY